MAVKFSVLRLGQPSDRGPNGECGIVLVGEQSGKSHGETVHCAQDHQHSKACAQDMLDAPFYLLKPQEPAIEEVQDGQGNVVIPAKAAVPAVMESPRERIQKWFQAQDVLNAAQDSAAAKVDPMPTKQVNVVENGKQMTKTVLNLDLT